MNPTVYIVHAIDAEGPLYESLDATFERLKYVFGYDFDPSPDMLKILQNGEKPLGGDEKLIQGFLLDKRIGCHSSWKDIDAMLDELTADDFRQRVSDSFGGGWVYSWFCMDHVGITGLNLRHRDMGYHNIFDHYNDYFRHKKDSRDNVQWHYHALSITNDAHHAGSTYLSSDHIYNILTRRVIDRSWFPTAFRPGCHTERPDSHFFLEQWIPFDFGNDSTKDQKRRPGISCGRYGDWRRAPKSWVPYHPSYQDYQIPGECNRYIARCLQLNERSYQIKEEDVKQAFTEAEEFGGAVLAFTGHDFRDIKDDVLRMQDMIRKVSSQYPGVKFKFSGAIEAMQGVFKLENSKSIGLTAELQDCSVYTKLTVKAATDIFGPQPFLALKLKGGQYYWQNFDFDAQGVWSYSFDSDNVFIEEVSQVGVASNNAAGVTEVLNIDLSTNEQKRVVYNR